jgi:dipeptidyl-peptidase III
MREGSQIEDDHMRNRQMIVHWLMANTKAIETRKRDGKTFREGVGRLLAEVQRIKGEGDYGAASSCSSDTVSTSIRSCAMRSSAA